MTPTAGRNLACAPAARHCRRLPHASPSRPGLPASRGGVAAFRRPLVRSFAVNWSRCGRLQPAGQSGGQGKGTGSAMTDGLLALVRHGQSEWNLAGRYTGRTDVDLTEAGVEEARNAGRLLKAEGFHFNVGFTSTLKRAQ